MTKLLEKAIEKVKRLPAKDQNNVARMMLDEVVWDDIFEKSKTKLDLLSKGVKADIKNGKFKKLN